MVEKKLNLFFIFFIPPKVLINKNLLNKFSIGFLGQIDNLAFGAEWEDIGIKFKKKIVR